MMGIFSVCPKNAHFRMWPPFLRAQVSLAECYAEYSTLCKNKTQLVQEQLDLQDEASLWFHFKPNTFREIILPLFRLHLPWGVWRFLVLEQFIWKFSPRNRLLETKHQWSLHEVCLPAAPEKWALLLLLLSWAKWSFSLITTAACSTISHQQAWLLLRFFCCHPELSETQPFFSVS